MQPISFLGAQANPLANIIKIRSAVYSDRHFTFAFIIFEYFFKFLIILEDVVYTEYSIDTNKTKVIPSYKRNPAAHNCFIKMQHKYVYKLGAHKAINCRFAGSV